MIKRTFLLTLALLFTLPAFAAAPVVPVWQIVKQDSTIGFEGTQMGAPFQGTFKSFDGTIAFDPANLAASKADITIHMDSADANSTDRNKYLPMADWFNTAQFPDARFVTTAIEQGLDKNQYVAKGNLTIRDVTLPITLPFKLDITKNEAGESVAKMNGGATLNRLDFGVGQGEWKDTSSVANPVKITISLTAIHKP